ncbi:MAG TPA: hypothetical protein VJX70_09360 [Candidatus Acidoferrum sp.]|nr:hypothetical protein [Candidatus Acidoferrum sp.]
MILLRLQGDFEFQVLQSCNANTGALGHPPEVPGRIGAPSILEVEPVLQGDKPGLVRCGSSSDRYPAMLWLVRDSSFARLRGVELWLSFIYGS